MKPFSKKFLKFRIVSGAFLASVFLIVGGWLWAFFALRKDTQPLILHFSDAVGINQIGGLGDLSAVAVFALAAVTLDFVIALELEERGAFLGKLLAVGGLFLAILIFIGFTAIISVN